MENRKKGKGCIRPEDNPKPFTKDYNGKDFEKYSEEMVHSILDELEDWLFLENIIVNKEGKESGRVDAGNCFYRDFLYKNKLFESWLNHVRERFSTVTRRMEDIDKIQEHKLQMLATQGKQKENITKFILQNKYNWREKTENENINKEISWIETKTYKDNNESDDKNI